MSGILIPKASKPPVAPENDDAAVEAAARERKLKALAGGKSATQVSGVAGDTSKASTIKTLLGGS